MVRMPELAGDFLEKRSVVDKVFSKMVEEKIMEFIQRFSGQCRLVHKLCFTSGGKCVPYLKFEFER